MMGSSFKQLTGLLGKILQLIEYAGLQKRRLLGIPVYVAALLFCELSAAALSIPLMSGIIEPASAEHYRRQAAGILPGGAALETLSLGRWLFALAIAILLLRLLSAAGVYSFTKHVIQHTEAFARSLRSALAERYFASGKAFFDQEGAGHLLNLCFENILPVSRQLRLLRAFTRALISAPIYLAVLLYISWQWTALALGCFAVLLPFFGARIAEVRAISARRSKANHRLIRRFSEVLQAGALVSLSERAEDELRFVRSGSAEVSEATVEMAERNALIRLLQQAAFAAATGLLLFFALSLLNTPGRGAAMASLLLFLYFTRRLHTQATDVVEVVGSLASIEGQIDQLLEMFTTAERCRVPEGRRSAAALDALDVSGLAFSYPDGTCALHDISFSIRTGEHVALIGPTGCGKSTLARLLVRLYDCPPDAILLNGCDIRRYRNDSARRIITLADQHPFLFRASIRDNLLYSADSPKDDMQLIEMLEGLGLAERIAALPNGLDSVIGARGVQLSGGEQQRLALARALLRESSLLILDETTSQLDTAAENLVQQYVAQRYAERALLIISHRMNFIRCCERVLVMDRGRIVDERRACGDDGGSLLLYGNS